MPLLQLEAISLSYVFISLAGLVLTLFLARWILAIDKLLDNQKTQTKLLKEMAIKLGVAEGEVKDIMAGWG